MFYFIIARTCFILFYFEKTSEAGIIDALKASFYGLRLDASFSAYVSLVPFLLILLSTFLSNKLASTLIKTITFPLIFIVSLLMIIDIGLYQSWGVRIDATLLNYIETPELMWASTSTSQIVFGGLFWLVLSLFFCYLFSKLINKKVLNFDKGTIIQAVILLLITAVLILPIRGGTQDIPINQSNVYFSDNMFANHAAVNSVWNFSYSLSKKTKGKNPYKTLDKELATSIINKRRNALLEPSFNDKILKTDSPNIILIIWESLTGKFVESIGGEPNVTSNLNKLSKEGILFSNFYGNGDRTDKGIIAILSGYYPQTNRSIIKIPSKARKLPMLTSKMMKLGYETSFYYGGDLNFGNMNTYFRNSGVTNFVDGSHFNKKDWSSKWGAYDHVFLDTLAKDLSKVQEKPFFKIALTLTSHEPFEFPGEFKFGKDNKENMFRSSHAYTDKAIGKFVDFAKKQPWWNNTLVVIMSDHGHWMPKHEGYYNSPKKFKIPMLWLGGALHKKDTVISTISAQTDFAYSLLKTMNKHEEANDFIWGKNIFNNANEQYAHYIFNNGFGTIDKNGVFVYDFTSKKDIISNGFSAKKLDSLGKAISQKAYQDFMDK